MAPERSKTNPYILGLTGPIACGKTTVGDLLLALGATERIDADAVVHTLLGTPGPVTASIAARFGQGVIDPEGAVNRAALGSIVFTDTDALRDLEAITHPEVRSAVRRRLDELSNAGGVVIVDAVKLLQSDLLPLCDAVWVVECNPTVQRARLTEKRGMSGAAAEARLRAQPDFLHSAVDTIIDNSGTLEELRAAVSKAWRTIPERNRRSPL